MLTSFHINTSDLGEDFVEKLKRLFGEKKNIVITVEEEDDTTLSLLSSAANRRKFEESLTQLNNNDLIPVSLEELKNEDY
jgi:hypothetical protein